MDNKIPNEIELGIELLEGFKNDFDKCNELEQIFKFLDYAGGFVKLNDYLKENPNTVFSKMIFNIQYSYLEFLFENIGYVYPNLHTWTITMMVCNISEKKLEILFHKYPEYNKYYDIFINVYDDDDLEEGLNDLIDLLEKGLSPEC